jgi:hypothetical protein
VPSNPSPLWQWADARERSALQRNPKTKHTHTTLLNAVFILGTLNTARICTRLVVHAAHLPVVVVLWLVELFNRSSSFYFTRAETTSVLPNRLHSLATACTFWQVTRAVF